MMARTLSLFTLVVLSLVFVAFAACGGDDENEGTQTATTPTGATPTESVEGTVNGPTFSGNATATVTIGEDTVTFKDGACAVGPDEAWLALNIGEVGGDNYFGLLVGANPDAPEGAQAVAGGGEFSFDDGEVALAGQHAGAPFVMSGAGSTVTVAPDLQSGEFEGTAFDGQPISGSFKC